MFLSPSMSSALSGKLTELWSAPFDLAAIICKQDRPFDGRLRELLSLHEETFMQHRSLQQAQSF